MENLVHTWNHCNFREKCVFVFSFLSIFSGVVMILGAVFEKACSN